MQRLKAFLKQIRAAIRPAATERDMRDELSFHLEQAADLNRRQGMSPEEARRQARLSFGAGNTVTEELRGAGLAGIVRGTARDLAHAARALVRRPGLAAAVVVTLGLGIGVSTAMYSVVYAVLLRPLPYPEEDRLTAVWETYPGWRGRPVLGDQWNRIGLAWPDYETWRAAQRTFDHVAVFATARMTITGGERSEVLAVGRASGSLWTVLGVQPVEGRLFGEAESGQGAASVAVLSHGLWQRRFGASAGVVGGPIQLDGQAFTVAGVLPRDFRFAGERSAPPDVWIPAGAGALPLGEDNHSFAGIGRLRAGVGLEAATTEAERLFLGARRPGSVGASLLPYRDQVIGVAREPLVGLLVGSLLLLLIAAVNVAALLAGDAGRRAAEIVTRRALGASSHHIVRQFLLEGFVLSIAAAAAGLGLAAIVLPPLAAIAPPDLPRLAEVAIDGRVLAFTLIAMSATTVVSAAGSVLVAAQRRDTVTLASGSRLAAGGRRLQPLFVGVQLALLTVLVTVGALFARSLLAVQDVDPGFATERILTAVIAPPADRFQDRGALVDFYRRLLEEVRRLPGVTAVSGVSTAPFADGSESTSVGYEGLAENARKPEMQRRVVLPGFIDLMRIPVRSGTGTLRGNLPEVLVSELLAARLWSDQPAVGRRISLRDRWYTVAGVVADIRDQALTLPPQGTYYVSQEAGREMSARMRLVMRLDAGHDPDTVAGELRRMMTRMDASVPMESAATLESLLGRSLSAERYRTVLVNVFAAAAVLLAVVGMFGVTWRVMVRRRREFGVRLALGARPSTLVASSLAASFAGAVGGLGVGLGATALVAPSLSAYLYELPPRDPATLAGSAAILLGVTLVATLVPAIRAARVNVVEVLREQ